VIDPSRTAVSPVNSTDMTALQKPSAVQTEKPAAPSDSVELAGGASNAAPVLKNLAASMPGPSTAPPTLDVGEAMKAIAGGGVAAVYDFQTGGPIDSSPAVGPDGVVYVTGTDGHLYGFKDGKKTCDVSTGGAIHVPPGFGRDGTVYVGNDIAEVTAVKDGQKLWGCQVGREVGAAPVEGKDGVVLVGCKDGTIYFVEDGVMTGGYHVEDWMKAPVVTADGTIITKRHSGLVMAFKQKHGLFGSKIVDQWEMKTSDGISSSNSGTVIDSRGIVYTGGADGNLYAIDRGKPVWAFPTKARINSTPCLGPDGTVFVGNDGGKLSAVKDGREAWSYKTGGAIQGAPSRGSDGTIFVGSDDGHVYALKDGALAWKFDAGEPVRTSPVQAPDGTVYVTLANGHVLGLRAVTDQMKDSLKNMVESVDESGSADKKPSVESDESFVVIDGVKIEKKADKAGAKKQD